MKIKKVVINGFRAYETAENGTFDFTTECGKCANFVAIFAPNGFGKTSFYDAVEYALTENISRFVRDAQRSDYDAASRTQVQRKRKQYVLRNHALPDTTVANITVTLDIAGREKTVEKPIPRPKTGHRDFHFKKKLLGSTSSGLSDVFLSQEAIDAFLREETAEARYTRFMSSFGDSDETYRANLATLKRELDSSVDETRSAILKAQEVAQRPIDAEIFHHINQSITNLEDDSLGAIDEQFDAERELSIRSRIASRIYELKLLNDGYDKRIAGLLHLASSYSTYQDALKQKKYASKLIAQISERRTEFETLDNARIAAKDLEAKRLLEKKINKALSEVFPKISEFESAILRRSQALSSKAANAEIFGSIQIELSAKEQREFECKRRIDEIDSETQDLLKSQGNSAAIFSQIEIKEEEAKSHQANLDKTQKYVDALLIKANQMREQFEKVRALKIRKECVDSPELALIASDEFSPIELRAASVELEAKESILVERTNALEATKLQSGRIAQFIDLGRSLVNEQKGSQCPLCSHTHDSYQELINAILGNDAISQREDEALKQAQDAELAFENSKMHFAELIRRAENAKAKRATELRQIIEKDDLELTSRKALIMDASKQLANARQEIGSLKNTTSNLPPLLFAEKLISEITQQQVKKEKEFKDLADTRSRIEELQTLRKNAIQDLEVEQAKLDAIDGSELFIRVSNFCKEEQIDFGSVRACVEKKLSESSSQLSDLDEKILVISAFISGLTSNKPYLLSWSDDDAIANKARAQQDELSADAIIIPFITNLKLHAQDFDEELLENKFESIVADSISMSNIARDSNELKLKNYNVLERQLDDIRPFVESLLAQESLKDLELELQEKQALESVLQSEYQNATAELDKKIQTFFYPDLINSIYRRIDPHPDFKRVEFSCNFEGEKPTLEVFVADQNGDLISPNLYFSAAQVNILSLSIFLARALHAKDEESEVGCIFIDDPIHSMDSINILSTIDLLRSLSLKFNRQIILSTHDKNFFELLQRKLPAGQCKAKFLELETFGKVVSY